MIHHRSCPLCEAMCGLAVETDGNEVRSVRGDPDDPLSRGYICPKGPALAVLHADPDRLRTPMIREGDRFREASWDEALDRAASGIVDVQRRHGKDAVASYLGNPTVHNLGAALFSPMLVRTIGGKNKYSATSVDQLPHHLASYWMFGHQFLLPIPDVDRTDLFVILGANPVASNGSLMTAPGMAARLDAIRAREGTVIVVDPRRTETAAHADEHLAIRPGTDPWLLGALLRLVLADGERLGRLAPYVERLPVLRGAVERFHVELAAERTGIAAHVIESIARRLLTTERAVVYGRMGVSTHPFGGVCQWMINALNLVSGHFDRVGGAMLTSPAIDIPNLPFGLGIGKGSFDRWRSRARDLPEHGGELPVATLADEILTPGEGQVHGLLTSAGNPVLSSPNGPRLERALGQLEHMVSVDFYINETTRFANVILPPPSPLERPQYDVVFHQLAVRNTAKFSDAVFDPGPGARHDWEIALSLMERIQRARGKLGLRERGRLEVMRRLGPVGLVDVLLGLGAYGPLGRSGRRLSVSRLRETPHGVDLGPLRERLPDALVKWRPRIDLAPRRFVDDLDRLEKTRAHDDGLVLIGRRHTRSCNSWMHNVPKLVAGKPICTLQIHPSDAEDRSILDGAEVRVRSRVGEVVTRAEVTDAVRRGVVSLPHGFGHDRPGVALDVARAHAGVSANDLTDHARLDELTGNAALNGTPVEVTSVEVGSVDARA
ncbi:MAG: molybdopterin-dependent oxidoreductase [Sandaracinaceae bacterium]